MGCGPGNETDETDRSAESSSTVASAPTRVDRTQPDYLEFRRTDLATAGLGIEGLRGGPPAPADPAAPTAEELRRLAVYHNYRALVDVSESGGFGRLYGPNPDDLPIPGNEYWALGNLPDGGSHVMLLQVPEGFPGERPCLVAAPSSGSRGPLGAIGTTGDWALRHDCAVVYSDKGAGPWMTNLGDDRAYAITGERIEKPAGARPSTRSGQARGRSPMDENPDSATIVEPFSTRTWPAVPDVAVKHAHSGHNPEARWGAMVIASIRFALERLDESHPGDRTYASDDILVIAASVSNGGGAVLAAAEADEEGLIDGVVASEPNVYVTSDTPLKIDDGDGPVVLPARPLYDYATLAALFGPCAALADRFGDAPMAGNLRMLDNFLAGRCLGLKELGLVEGDDTAAQAASAYRVMLDHGIHPEAADAQPANTLINVWALVGGVYANAYGRFEPTDRLCGTGFRAFDAANQPARVDPARAAQLFGTSPGVPPVAGIDIAAVSADSTTKLIFATSETAGGSAYGLDQVRCLRGLWTGGGERGERVRKGVRETALSGDLRGKPAIIVHGRSDALVWVNHSSRAYVAANRAVESKASRLRYLEVTNAQHFDTLLGFPGFAARFVPLHLYFERALDRLYRHLTEGAALPDSQVVLAKPRGTVDGGTPALAPHHVPAIGEAEGTRKMHWPDGTLRIPQ